MVNNLILIVGTRPNFIKLFPVCKQLDKQGVSYIIFNTNQHYSKELNNVFEQQFDLNKIFSIQTTKDNKIKRIQDIRQKFSSFINKRKQIGGIIVVGDVDSSYACALAITNTNIPLIHIESGLRSFDYGMHEELNRITIDSLSNILFAHCKEAVINLQKEGITKNVFMVGNIMVDCLEMFRKKIESSIPIYKDHLVVTLHRPENVDGDKLFILVQKLIKLSKKYKVLFPVHPRTRERLATLKLIKGLETNLTLIPPLSYLKFMTEVFNCRAVITDSGGIQEETSYLGIPCFTVRKNTERNITIEEGTNKLIKLHEIDGISYNSYNRTETELPLWDGKTSKRIIKKLKELL